MCGSVLGERKYDKYKLRFWGTREGDLLFSPDCHIVSFNLLKLLASKNIHKNFLYGVQDRQWQ